MTNKKYKKTKYFSYLKGKLPKGCKQCVKGEKLVLFVTGLCANHCYFCPISDQKKDKDVVYANEWPVNSFEQIIEEAKLCEAKGAGITGGDPLVKLERTCDFIKKLKNEFGKEFHIHLYTPLIYVNDKNLEKLYNAGLDEIRFHLSLDKKDLWSRLSSAKKFNWSVGVEIPVIPGKEGITKELMDFIEGKVDFLNLNELEFADTEACKLGELGFVAKDNISSAVKGSAEMALNMLKYGTNKKYSIHFCTARLKNFVQLTERIKRRAKNVKLPFDEITKDGMLKRAAVYLPELIPGFGYRKKLNEINKKEFVKKLEKVKEELKKKFKVSNELLFIDELKPRILTSKAVLNKICKKIPYKCAVVVEYPTHDETELDVDFLN